MDVPAPAIRRQAIPVLNLVDAIAEKIVVIVEVVFIAERDAAATPAASFGGAAAMACVAKVDASAELVEVNPRFANLFRNFSKARSTRIRAPLSLNARAAPTARKSRPSKKRSNTASRSTSPNSC